MMFQHNAIQKQLIRFCLIFRDIYSFGRIICTKRCFEDFNNQILFLAKNQCFKNVPCLYLKNRVVCYIGDIVFKLGFKVQEVHITT